MHKLCNKLTNIETLKKKSYNLILVIINSLIKVVYYKLLKTIINLIKEVKVIIDVVIYIMVF